MSCSPASSGAGTSVGPSCALTRDAPLDIRPVASHPILWDALYDNAFDFNVLGAIPSGLGLTFAFNGSAATITTTAAGVWAFSYMLVRGADATWGGNLNTGIAADEWDSGTQMTALIVALASGTALAPSIDVTGLATANPYNTSSITLAISRLV